MYNMHMCKHIYISYRHVKTYISYGRVCIYQTDMCVCIYNFFFEQLFAKVQKQDGHFNFL